MFVSIVVNGGGGVKMSEKIKFWPNKWMKVFFIYLDEF